LPTWLSVTKAGDQLRFEYVYDDGPSKTVKEISLMEMNLPQGLYSVKDSTGKLEETYKIAGLEQLSLGRGTLTLTGDGMENGKPVDVRTTLRIGRNILEIVRETAPPGQAFTFRHSYTLVRAAPPGN